MKAAGLISLALIASSTAHADSWCNFDVNFLGLKAIGGISPLGFNTRWGDPNPFVRTGEATEDCMLNVFATSSTTGPSQWIACIDVKHVAYISPGDDTAIYHYYGTGGSLVGTDYWQLQILAQTEDMFALETNLGERVWWPKSARHKRKLLTPAYQAGPESDIAQTSSKQVYGAPDFATELAPASFNDAEQYAFFEALLAGVEPDEERVRYLTDYGWRYEISRYIDYLDKRADYLLRHPERQKPMNPPGETPVIPSAELIDFGRTYINQTSGFAIGYDVKEIITADDGSLWYLADERIIANVYRHKLGIDMKETFEHYPSGGEQVYHLYSPPIREVYLPYRASDGTVLSVFLSGDYCD